MSFLPAYFGARKRDTDLAPPTDEPEDDDQLRRDIFDLIPPRAANRAMPLEMPDAEALARQPGESGFDVSGAGGSGSGGASAGASSLDASSAGALKPIGKNKHPVDMTDLSRLSIDTDGQLYWDGKPVKSRRELSMSRAQIFAACLVTMLIVIGAAGAAIQGSAIAHEWACRLGWTQSYCALPAAAPAIRPSPHADIPA